MHIPNKGNRQGNRTKESVARLEIFQLLRSKAEVCQLVFGAFDRGVVKGVSVRLLARLEAFAQDSPELKLARSVVVDRTDLLDMAIGPPALYM